MEHRKNWLVLCLTAGFLFVFSLWNILKPDIALSESERRALAQNFNGYLLHHNALRVDSRRPTGRSGRMPASPECR